MNFNDLVWPDSPATPEVDALYRASGTTSLRFQPDWGQVPGGFWAKRFEQHKAAGVLDILLTLDKDRDPAYLRGGAVALRTQAESKGLTISGVNCGNELRIFRDGQEYTSAMDELARMGEAASLLKAAGFTTHLPSIGAPTDRHWSKQLEWWGAMFGRLASNDKAMTILTDPSKFNGHPCISGYVDASTPQEAAERTEKLRKFLHPICQGMFGRVPLWLEWGFTKADLNAAAARLLKAKRVRAYYFVSGADPARAPTTMLTESGVKTGTYLIF